MTRAVAALALAASLAPAAAAQAAPLEIGLRAGVDVATLNLDGPIAGGIETEPRFGPTAGVWIAWTLTPAWALETGIDWRTKGARTSDEVPYLFPGGDGRAHLVWDHRSLEVPLLLRWSPLGHRAVEATLSTGPAFAFPVMAEVRPEGADDAAVDERDALEAVDVGWQAGIGLVFAGAVRAELRYTHGTDDVYDDRRLDGGRNRALAATLGYRFRP